MKSDKDNGNAYLAKSVIDIYLLNKKNARISINLAKKLEKSTESDEVLNIAEGLTHLLEMQFINAYKSFSFWFDEIELFILIKDYWFNFLHEY